MNKQHPVNLTTRQCGPDTRITCFTPLLASRLWIRSCFCRTSCLLFQKHGSSMSPYSLTRQLRVIKSRGQVVSQGGRRVTV